MSATPEPTFEKTSRAEEIGNIITHGIGIPFALTAIILLVGNALERDSTLYFVAVLLYGLTMLFTYLSSTLYHSTAKASVQRRNLYHLLDHTAIYLFIAGTYTPIALFVLPGAWSWGIFIGIWTLALVGTFFKVYYLGRFKKLSLVFYLLMGWMIVLAIQPLLANASDSLLTWILAGGVAYSVGTIFFSLRRLPFSHSVWHLFVLAGSVCHFIGIYLYL